MNQRKAKAIRKAVYGDKSIRTPAIYTRDYRGFGITITREPIRQAYQMAKTIFYQTGLVKI